MIVWSDEAKINYEVIIDNLSTVQLDIGKSFLEGKA
jgi:hypothetical protein